MSLYYKLCNGDWVSELAVNTAFCLTSGKERNGNESEFLDWLDSHLNKTILEVKASTDPTLLDEAIASENKILAIKLYMEQNNCRLAEAKVIVESMLEGRNQNGKVQQEPL